MATRCPSCGKKSITGTTRVLLRGHYNPTAKHRQHPNLQWAKVPDTSTSAGWRRMRICTDCIKTLNRTPKTA